MQNTKTLTLSHLAEKEAQAILLRNKGPLKRMVSSEGGLDKLIAHRKTKFWAAVDTSPSDGCWPWLCSTYVATSRHLPYGKTKLFGYGTTAHRAAYILTYGSVPVEMNVCHTCDNPPCCNPIHLFLGDDFDNQRDSVSKGRWRGSDLK